MILAAIFGLAQIVSVYLLMAYLRERDAQDRKERRELYQRLQAPETAVAMAVAEEQSQLLAPVEAEDDKDFHRNRRDRLWLAGEDASADVPEPPIDEGDLVGVS